jgi:hypothetical protein
VKILTILDIRKPANAISANAGFTHCLASGRKIAKDRHLYRKYGVKNGVRHKDKYAKFIFANILLNHMV